MWGMKGTTIPVVIGALGLIKKGLEKYIQQIPGNIKIQELQNITPLGLSHILRRHPRSKRLTLILTLGPRNGFGHYMLYYGGKLKKIITIITLITTIMIIVIIIITIIIIITTTATGNFHISPPNRTLRKQNNAFCFFLLRKLVCHHIWGTMFTYNCLFYLQRKGKNLITLNIHISSENYLKSRESFEKLTITTPSSHWDIQAWCDTRM